MKQSYRFFISSIMLLGMSWQAIMAQEDNLIGLLGEETEKEQVVNAFKSPRVVNSHSIEMLGAGALDFRILHRFGKISDGFYNLFGLDNASMRMSFDYGISSNLSIGIGRSTNRKEMDGFAKYRLLSQTRGSKPIPISLVLVGGAAYNGLRAPFSNPEIEPTFKRRLAYYTQLIIGRKFNEKISLQLAPTWLHRNIVEQQQIDNDLMAIELGARYKLVKRVALIIDYSYILNPPFPNSGHNPLSIGFDIDTGGHVFQLHFSNAVGMNERALLSEANGDWLNGDIQFGFNLSRVFQLKKIKKADQLVH
ncbi:DUF5777 family beta-barrel protein [Haliscomenobacter sp.]|uniref:DUF5777 family beta-barrel protein n=1 Tax=Haliscomenobacter sp. TaxID=2717303 RepID=UPI003364B9A4